MAVSATSQWLKFFKEAGVPLGEATNYAVTFTDHRIQLDMLPDLTKEYLNCMDIVILGDIIAILKHAKTVHAKNKREMVPSTPVPGTPSPASRRQMTQSGTASPLTKRSTPASRIIEHCLGNDPEASPLHEPFSAKISENMASRLGLRPTPTGKGMMVDSTVSSSDESIIHEEGCEIPVKKKRRVLPENEGKYKIIMPKGKTLKTAKILAAQGLKRKASVFKRLGGGGSEKAITKAPTIRVTGLGKVKLSSLSKSTHSESIFNRLGGKKALKRKATSTTHDLSCTSDEDNDGDEVLEYAGVLKEGAQKKKAVLSPLPPKKPILQRLGTQKVEATTTTSTMVSDKGQLSAKHRLGDISPPRPSQRNKISILTKKTISPSIIGIKGKQSLKIRLTHKNTTSSADIPTTTTTKLTTKKPILKTKPTASAGVFSRLGKKT